MSRKIVIFIIILLSMLIALFNIPSFVLEEKIVHQHHKNQEEILSETGLKEGQLTSHLPIIIIDTKGQGIPGMDRESDLKLICDYKIINHKAKMNHSDDEKADDEGRLALSLRGNSSLHFPKKQYSLKLLNKNNKAKNESLMGMPKHSAWVLNGSYIDDSLIRNYMLYNISGEIFEYAPRARFCEMMFKNEHDELDYQGVYLLLEKPRVDKNRLDLTPYDKNHKETSFMLQINTHIDNYEIKHLLKNDALTSPLDLEYPRIDDITPMSIDYIQQEVRYFEKMLYDAEHTGDWGKVNEAIDDSFVDYFILNEFIQNYDAGIRSTFIHKNLGGKYCIGPVWDFDASFNNFASIDIEIDELKMTKQSYYALLVSNPEFSDKCIRRYKELRKTYLSDEYLLNYIDETIAYLGSSIQRDVDLWHDGDMNSFLDEIEDIKEYIKNRGKWMDENFESSIQVINW